MSVLLEIPGRGVAFQRLLFCMEKAWPHEACGALFVSPGGEWKWRPIENAAENPACTFAFGEGWLGLLQEEESRHARLACWVHSHPNGEANLSRQDIQHLAPGGRWLWPGVLQMVVATGKEGWKELAWFGFEEGRVECRGRWSRTHFEARKTRRFKL